MDNVVEFDLDYDSSDEEHAPLARQLSKQQRVLQEWVSSSRTKLGLAAARVAKEFADGKTAITDLGEPGADRNAKEASSSSIATVLDDLERWVTEDYPAKRELLKVELQDALDDIRHSEEGRAMDLETLCEQVEDLELALTEVHGQAQNLRTRLLTIRKVNEEQAAEAEHAASALLATQNMSTPPAPFTEGKAAAEKASSSRGRNKAGRNNKTTLSSSATGEGRRRPASLGLDDLLAQVEQQNLKHEALQAMGVKTSPAGNSATNTSSRKRTPGSGAGGIVGGHGGGGGGNSAKIPAAGDGSNRTGVERLNSLFEKNPNVRKATEDVRTFFSAFGSRVKAATEDGLKHVRRAADDSKSQFERVKLQLQKGLKATSPGGTTSLSPSTPTVPASSPGVDVAQVNSGTPPTAGVSSSPRLPHGSRAPSNLSSNETGRINHGQHAVTAAVEADVKLHPNGPSSSPSSPSSNPTSPRSLGRARPVPPPPPPPVADGDSDDNADNVKSVATRPAVASPSSSACASDTATRCNAGEQQALAVEEPEPEQEQNALHEDGELPTAVSLDELNALLCGRNNDIAVYTCLEQIRHRHDGLQRRRQRREEARVEVAQSDDSVVDTGSSDARAAADVPAQSSKSEDDTASGGEETAGSGGNPGATTGDNDQDDNNFTTLFPAPLTQHAPLVVAVQNGRLEACRYMVSQFYGCAAASSMPHGTSSIGEVSAVTSSAGATTATTTRLDLLAIPFTMGARRDTDGGGGGARATTGGADEVDDCGDWLRVTLLHLAALLPEKHLSVLTWVTRAVWGGYADGEAVWSCSAGMSPTLLACCAGNLPAIQRLVGDHGADVGVTAICRSNDISRTSSASAGWTAAHCAAAGGHLHVLQWLKKSGHPCTARDAHGCTPLQVAVAAGHNDCAAFLCDA